MPRPARLTMAWLRRPPVVLLLVVALLGSAWVALAATASPGPPAVTSEDILFEVPEEPGSTEQVSLDATIYRPQHIPAPAVLLAHGFGGSKAGVYTEATELAERGFVVLAWSARGFGASTGQIGLNAPDQEVADARLLVDWLAEQPDVVRDAPGDPRVGVAGSSYGGALALLLAGTDPRVDALAPMMSWNDLAQAFFPNAASTAPLPAGTPAAGAFSPDGVFKRDWAALFFSAGSDVYGIGSDFVEMGADDPQVCGRFHPAVCDAYLDAATTGAPDPDTVSLLHRSSPSSVTDRITAPTLLVQGTEDTLFGLDQADATARQLAAAGAQVKMVWYAGGHDGAYPGIRLWGQVGDWFDYHLAEIGDDPGTGFEYQVQSLFGTRSFSQRTVTAPAYPGLVSPGQHGSVGGPAAVQRHRFALYGEPQIVLRPPGASPAAVSSLPRLGSALPAAAGAFGGAADPPGQAAMFVTDPLTEALDLTGAPQVRLQVAAAPETDTPASDTPGTGAGHARHGRTTRGARTQDTPGGGVAPPGEAVLFVKLYDVAPDGRSTLPGGAVAPVRVGPLADDGTPVEVTVTLAGMVRPVEAGNRLAVAVSTTDRGYALPEQPARYRIALSDGAELTVPVVPGEQLPVAVPVVPLAGLGGLAVLVLALGGLAALRHRRADDVDPALTAVPLVVTGLSKRYPGGITAVHELSFRIERGLVLGLLGPNGAGKTTVLRMLMGLIRPSAGELRVFGHQVRPGSPVLSRIGSFVEGPGFLPHLSGADNLRLYWAATGRPETDADIADALDIAGLGDAVHRRVATYSHGMRQRLAIAQAMLGKPDLLVLDEPTNGLDPPQIHAMREVLRAYAAGGRTVLVSSHLLAEVEQTCTHVVVMHRGRLVAAGPVAEIVAGNGAVSFTVDDPDRASAVLREQDGIQVLGLEHRTVHARLDGLPSSAAVAALVHAGVGVDTVTGRNRLEEAFLQLVGEEAVE